MFYVFVVVVVGFCLLDVLERSISKMTRDVLSQLLNLSRFRILEFTFMPKRLLYIVGSSLHSVVCTATNTSCFLTKYNRLVTLLDKKCHS